MKTVAANGQSGLQVGVRLPSASLHEVGTVTSTPLRVTVRLAETVEEGVAATGFGAVVVAWPDPDGLELVQAAATNTHGMTASLNQGGTCTTKAAS